MLTKTITYTDYNNNRRTEDFYFNLSRAELIEMEYSMKGGLSNKLAAMSKSADPAEIVALLKDIILRSYGKKSDDGQRFIKSREMSEEFEQTEAYSELILELMKDEKAAADFMNGLTSNLEIDQNALEAAKAKANISALPTANAK